MRRHRHTGRPLDTARTALCVVAMVANAALPLVHAQHGGAASLDRALAWATARTSDVAHLAARDAAAAPVHEAASCPVCVTLAHAAALTPTLSAAAGPLPIVAGRLASRTAAGTVAPDRSGAAPRAPPALLS